MIYSQHPPVSFPPNNSITFELNFSCTQVHYHIKFVCVYVCERAHIYVWENANRVTIFKE